jgi:uncharacterized protein with PIN domain
VSEEAGNWPAPFILDASVIIAVARGDSEATEFILNFDARGTRS